MSILDKLSSKKKDRSEDSNREVAKECLTDPMLLNEIAIGLNEKDKKLLADCMEVFTFVAEVNPEIVVPFCQQITPLLKSKETKARWEAVHTLSLIAEKVPLEILVILPDLQDLIEKDSSTIVKDYATETVAQYAKCGEEAASQSFGILKFALEKWDEKHAKQVFHGFLNILEKHPGYKSEIAHLVQPYVDSNRKTVAAVAKKIMKLIDK